MDRIQHLMDRVERGVILPGELVLLRRLVAEAVEDAARYRDLCR